MPSSINQSDLGTTPSSTRSDQTTGVQREPVADKHTRGPWRIRESFMGSLWIEGGLLTDPDHVVIVSLKDTVHEREGNKTITTETARVHAQADAYLIASAPELVAAHQENARILGFLVNELQGRIEGGKLGALAGCLDRSSAALSKALGTEER